MKLLLLCVSARAAAGKIIQTCRDTISIVAVALNAPRRLGKANDTEPESNDLYKMHDDLLDKYARWLCAFPVAAKNFLRSRMDCKIKGWDDDEHVRYRQDELIFLLNPDDTQSILNGQHTVLVVLDRLRALAYDTCFVADLKLHPTATAELYNQLNAHINSLSGAFGAMERISGFALPFVYVAHLRLFILLYLFLFNMYSIANAWVEESYLSADGWIALIVLLALNWAILGLEAASVEMERPFGLSPNHLPLAKFCIVVGENIVQTLDEVKQQQGR